MVIHAHTIVWLAGTNANGHLCKATQKLLTQRLSLLPKFCMVEPQVLDKVHWPNVAEAAAVGQQLAQRRPLPQHPQVETVERQKPSVTPGS